MHNIGRTRVRTIRSRLLGWARNNLRDFPWRRPYTSPYEVLVAELLLKRTTATAAAREYGPFLERYPTVGILALASEEELAQTLRPLGLSRQRASAVKQLAQTLSKGAGVIPKSLTKLRALPSLGDYSARAIMSFGHDVPVAVVDGNVERVMRRVFLDTVGAAPSRPTIQLVADKLLPRKQHRTFNFALLDLGSLICRPLRPKCQTCPLQRVCNHANTQVESAAPTPLRVARTSRGISLVNLAALAGVSKLTIINIEARRTRPRTETAQKLADALGLSASALIEN